MAASSLAVDFLVRLKRIDRHRMTVRDVLFLYTVINNPGINGLEGARSIGVKERSGIVRNIERLIKFNMIEDRREVAEKAIANRLYPLPAGIAFWEALRP